MARIVLGSYMVRYPLGGMMSYVVQYLIGLQRLGHEVYFVEKAGYSNSCYDPGRDVMSDDCTYGVRAVSALLARFGLEERWCFVDAQGVYYGLPRERIEAVLRAADLFLDMGTHGSWLEEARGCLRVLLDGEPGFTQMKMWLRKESGQPPPEYDFYYTVGANVGTPLNCVPTLGRSWRTFYHPVVVDMFPLVHAHPEAPFSTVMNWQSHKPLEYRGRVYGQKDVEFAKFMDLPRYTSLSVEVAVSGINVPMRRLLAAGWAVRDAHTVTASFDSFVEYIRASRGEFSVCKNVFVATNCGWFSDRSAAYLASGRPVVMQDTGFSKHLPCGRGLFAVRTIEEAAAAIEEIDGNYASHSRTAREIAMEHLEAGIVLGGLLRELGIAG